MVEAAVKLFAGAALEEIPLSPAPLDRVLAQLRFPPVLSIAANDTYIAEFQNHLRARYPILTQEAQMQALFGPDGVLDQRSEKLWRLKDIDERWSVVLGTGFVTLETTSYSSRDDFVERLREVFEALQHLATPAPVVVTDRLGVRYVNVLRGPELERLREYLAPEVYGPLGVALPAGMEMLASAGQAHFQLDGPQMQARWAKLPPNAGFLPDLAPAEEPTWVLDIDVYLDARAVFDPDELARAAKRYAEYAYSFFRWAMQDTFIVERRTNAK